MRGEAFLFLIGHYVFLISVGILSYGMGRRLTHRISYYGPLEELSFCTTLGLGFLAYLILLLGTLGILYRWLVLAVLGMIFIGCTPVWVELIQRLSTATRQKRWMNWRAMGLSLLALLCLSPFLLMPLYPPTAWDSTAYHLAYAKIYAQAHGMTLTPYLRYPVFPQTNEMLFTFALLLYDDIAAQLIQFLMMTVIGVALFAFGRRHFSQRTGTWAAAIFLSNPMVLWLGTSAYIDIGLTLFVVMGIYALFNHIYFKERSWLILGALFIGCSAGSKYSALFFLILFGLFTFYIGFRERKFLYPFIFLATAIGVAFPWYFRNWYYTGNPVFPFLGQVFGYGLWNQQDLQRQLHDLMVVHGAGKTFQSLLLLPWNLAFHQPVFLMEAPYSKIYLFALPFFVVSLFRSKTRELSVLILLYTFFWFSTAQLLRYLMPIIPFLGLVVSASFENCLEWLPSHRVAWAKSWILTWVIFVMLIRPGWLYAVDKIWKEGYPPHNKKERGVYLSQRLPSFPAYQYMNQTKGYHYTVYALIDENMAYFADGTFMGDWFGPGRYERMFGKFGDCQALLQELRLLGADYFLIRRREVSPKLPDEGFFKPPFQVVYENGDTLLFEVSK